METSNPTATGWRSAPTALGIKTLFGALLGGLAITACLGLPEEAEARGLKRVEDSRAAEKRGGEVVTAVRKASTSTHRTGRGFETRARLARNWKMPVGLAKQVTLETARLFFRDTTPTEFDTSGWIIGDSWWDYYGAGDCQRISRSRVDCIGVTTSDFDEVDANDQVIGSDTFICGWDQAIWYPRARTKRLKTDILDAVCGWESEL